AMAALCAHRLRLDLDAPVARWWPEFAQAGKAGITVRQLLGHLAGLVYPDLAPEGSLFDWAAMTDALARQAPEWPAGSRGAYHSSTYGHLVGELVQRACGQPFERYFAERIAGPCEADFHFGLTPALEARVAPLLPNPANLSARAILSQPASGLGRAWRPIPKLPDVFNSAAWRRCVFPSANGHGNARGAARIFSSIAQSDQEAQRVAFEQWHAPCALTGRLFRTALGFWLNDPHYHPMGPNPGSFGHAGLGGSFAFVDPARRLAFAYSMNQLCEGDTIGPRCKALVEAVFDG
ncbi:MAG: beta-lactamase family protein, partial [Burkholderiales bacterium]|nr:beta-lactamase family protein [Burkholderiales bacterium]